MADPLLLAVGLVVLLVAALVAVALLAVAAALQAGQHPAPPPAGDLPTLEEMPGHPERVRALPDPHEHEQFGDIAEQLLDDGLADVAEDLGWMQ